MVFSVLHSTFCTMKFLVVVYTGMALTSRGVSEVSRNQSSSDRDTLIEQSITLIKQSQYSEQQYSKLCCRCN